VTQQQIKFDQAIAYHQKGQLLKAKAIYEEILIVEPANAAVLHLLGVIHYQMNEPQRALYYYDQAISIAPHFADAYSNRGLALHDLKQFEAAVASYDNAIAIRSDYPEAFFNRGLALHELKQFESAVMSYDRAIAVQPDYAEAYSNCANTLQELNRFEDAVAYYDQAIAIRPDYADAYYNRGNALEALKQLEEAIASYDRAIALKPDYAQAYCNRGLVLRELDQLDAAIESYDHAIAIKPDYVEAYSNRGNALQELKKLEEAVANFDHAIAIKPDHADAYYNRGNALKGLERLEESVASFERAIAIKPDHAEAYFNRGLVLHELKKLEEAISSYDHAIAIKPDHAEAHWSKALAFLSKSLTLLSTGDLSKGWELYEWRSKREKVKFQPFEIANEWDGKKLAGSLLVLPEQGIGDEIFYSGMLNDLKGMADLITACVDPRLITLYQRSFDFIEFIPEAWLPNVKAYDAQIYMPGLGRYFRPNLESLQNVKVPYLKACPEKTTQLRNSLASHKKLICGLSWVSKNPENGPHKTLELKDLIPLLSMPDINFVDLQYGDTQEEQTELFNETGIRLTQVSEVDNFYDIDGLASLIEACDVVLTISNSTAHLAGALGQDVIMMLPYSKGLHWYWHEGNGPNPWYPTANLFRQDTQGDWQSVMARVKLELEVKINKQQSRL
jgi:tetratricopeptide (TPR) repeat protein